MHGEQKLHAKVTACQSKDLDGTSEEPAAGLTMLPPSLLVPLGYLQVKCSFPPPHPYLRGCPQLFLLALALLREVTSHYS